MKRSQWIVLLALAALNTLALGLGAFALAGAAFAPGESMPTYVAAVTLPPASATPSPMPLTPTPSLEAVETASAVEPVSTATVAEPSATAVPPTAFESTATDIPVDQTPTASLWQPATTPEPAVTEAPAQATPVPAEAPPTEATSTPAEAPPTATPVPPTPTATLVVALNVPASYIFPAAEHARQIFLQGRDLGNRPGVFALVGDSNTDNPNFFAPFDSGNYALGEYAYLQETISFFRGSFAQRSPAAVGSFNTSKVLDPAYADHSRCLGGESPLACAYRLQRPSVALILIGTGDHLDWANFEGRYRSILDYTLSQGIIPVLLTKADDLESKEQGAPYDFTNNIIRRLSGEYDVPLLDLRRVVELLPNRGCVADGFHYNTPPDGRSADFTGSRLSYGYNVRNLTGLLALDELRRQVLQP